MDKGKDTETSIEIFDQGRAQAWISFLILRGFNCNCVWALNEGLDLLSPHCGPVKPSTPDPANIVPECLTLGVSMEQGQLQGVGPWLPLLPPFFFPVTLWLPAQRSAKSTHLPPSWPITVRSVALPWMGNSSMRTQTWLPAPCEVPPCPHPCFWPSAHRCSFPCSSYPMHHPLHFHMYPLRLE